ncbi:MAG: dihydropteroate synthase [Gammaproteobacteria bacterium]|nr:dihydropteroate synthase [Gammaproteobacteria bacterium]
MGVLNVTPDSFSDGGLYTDVDSALAQARAMIAAGAAVIDVGGESTRPGARSVPLDEELDRVVPVIAALAELPDAIISIDTRKPEVMRAALAAGAHMVNDVNALRAPGAVAAVAETGAAVCLMHMRGEPESMQQQPQYSDVVAEVHSFLQQRVAAVTGAGVPLERILIDPGFGFGKTLQHNLALLNGLGRLSTLGCPVLVGFSRKSMIGELLDAPPLSRLHGSQAAAVMAVAAGARLVRSHDVGPTEQALRVASAVLGAG